MDKKEFTRRLIFWTRQTHNWLNVTMPNLRQYSTHEVCEKFTAEVTDSAKRMAHLVFQVYPELKS